MSANSGVACNGSHLDSPFDFLTSVSDEPIPVYEVEARLAESRRQGRVARDVSQHEFAKKLGITPKDISDPDTKVCCLDFSEAFRSYYGDPDDEVYRKFEENMAKFTLSDTWLKGSNFLQEDILRDYLLLKKFESEALELLETNDEDIILEVEKEVYAEVRCEPQQTNIQRYRDEHCPRVLALRLSFERCRRAANAVGKLGVHEVVFGLLGDPVTQKKCRYGRRIQHYLKPSIEDQTYDEVGEDNMRRVNNLVRPPQNVAALRAYHMPGWKNKVSTKDARTREQREADRKTRQIEKLPRPQALHDFQYPYEKTVLSDTMFQYPVYEDELDTPHLFNLTPPPDFFVYWNVMDFERTFYPSLPSQDHRLLLPRSDFPHWKRHRQLSLNYLRKHEVMPHFLPHVLQEVNLSVVFPGTYATRAQRCEETCEPLPPPPPVTELTPRNFWMTSHCGNYIELTDLQHPPSIFFLDMEAEGDNDKAGGMVASSHTWYTLIIASPDFPYRGLPDVDGQGAKRGFFLNYMVANLPGGGIDMQSVLQQEKDDPIKSALVSEKNGDVVVPYIPPLPTEDAGTTRHLCMLFKQSEYVDNVFSAIDDTVEGFAARSNFRLHMQHREGIPSNAAAMLLNLECQLPTDPSAVTFFQTKWDIQVQEFYESRGIPEPAAPPDEEIETILGYHARSPATLRVRARHRPDGSTNMGDDPNFWAQAQNTSMMKGSMQNLWSCRTALGRNGVPVTYRR